MSSSQIPKFTKLIVEILNTKEPEPEAEPKAEAEP